MLSGLRRVLMMGTCTMHNRHGTHRFQRIPTEWTCSFNGIEHGRGGPAGRVHQRALRAPPKRSVLLAQSHRCLDRPPKRQMMVIASGRLASTWSRRSITQLRQRVWDIERAPLEMRLQRGTYRDLLRLSGYGKAMDGPVYGRAAARSSAVPAAINVPVNSRVPPQRVSFKAGTSALFLDLEPTEPET